MSTTESCVGLRCQRVASTTCGTIAKHRANRAAKRMANDGDLFGDAVGNWGADVDCAGGGS